MNIMKLAQNLEKKIQKPSALKSVTYVLPRKDRVDWDTKLANFGKRILPSGEARWVVVRRPAGSTRLVTVTIGRTDSIPLAKARTMAQAIIGQLASGVNPNAAKRATREAERQVKAKAKNTFLQMARSYLKRCEERGRRSSTVAEYARMIQNADLAPWHARPIDGISASEIEGLLARVKERAPVQANRLLEFLSALFKHAVRKGVIPSDPLAKIDREEVRHKEISRKRTLVHPYTGDVSELLAVWCGVESIEPAHHPLRALTKLLILTGARAGVFARSHPGQLDALTWRHVKDLDRPNQARLEIPPALRKTGGRDDDLHVLPLSPAAVEVLNGLAKVGEDAPVFTTDGIRPIRIDVDQRNLLRKLADDAFGAKLEHWTPHDLRRSTATGLGRLGTPHAVIDEILDHAGEAKAGIRGTYDRSKRVEICREWLTKWAEHLAAGAGE
jgi:integrase